MRYRGIAKLSISLPRELAQSMRRRAGARGVSSFAARAIRHELEREQLGEYLAELEAEFGPVPDELMNEARRAWQKS